MNKTEHQAPPSREKSAGIHALNTLRSAIHAVIQATQACSAAGHLAGNPVMLSLDVALSELRDAKANVQEGVK